tara:strand:+ start:942 stop:1208 length:267 start_codon:yes stop_codon:yes gene_type:complete
MFNKLILVLFGLILLAYIFAKPDTQNLNMSKLDSNCSNDFKPDIIPFQKITLEEEIVNNMKTRTLSSEEINPPTFQPIIPESNGTILN